MVWKQDFAIEWRYQLRRWLRRRGWELRRLDPSRSLDEHLYFLLDELRINCVVDVGAHHGEYCRFLRRLGYQGLIASFEPVGASSVILQRSQAADSRWRGYQLALGSVGDSRRIYTMQGSSFNSFLEPAESAGVFGGNQVTGSESVRVVRLDAIIDDVTQGVGNPRIYLKMDTQGWDLEVLRGAEGCLDQIVAIQSEMSVDPLYHDAVTLPTMLSALRERGFEASGLFNLNHHANLRLAELEGVFLKLPRQGG